MSITDPYFSYSVVSITDKTLAITGINPSNGAYALSNPNWGAFPSIPSVYAGSHATYNGDGTPANAFKIVEISANAFDYLITTFAQTSITSTFLPANLKRIGTRAFANVKLSGTLTIPATIDSVGFQAFHNTLITGIVVGSSDIVTQLSDLTSAINQEINERVVADASLNLLKAPIESPVFTGTATIPNANIELATLSSASIASAKLNIANIASASFSTINVIGNAAFGGTVSAKESWNFTVQPEINGDLVATESHVNVKIASIAGPSLVSAIETLSELASAIGGNTSFATHLIQSHVSIASTLSNEISTRIAAVSSLSSALSASISSLSVVETALSTGLSAETVARSTSVAELSTALSRDVSSLQSNNIATSTALSTEISTRSSEITNASTIHGAAVSSLQLVDAAISTALSTEASARSSAIASLAPVIVASAATLSAADEILSTALSTETSHRLLAVASVSQMQSDAFSTLSIANDTLSTALTSAISARTGSISSLSESASTQSASLQLTNTQFSIALATEVGARSSSISSLSSSITGTMSSFTSANSSGSSMLITETLVRSGAVSSVSASMQNAATSISTSILAQNTVLGTETTVRNSQMNSLSTQASASIESLSTVNAAVSTALLGEVTNRSTAISAAVQNILSGAPVRFNTLEKIALEMTTNTSLTINASTLAVVSGLRTSVSAETVARASAVASLSNTSIPSLSSVDAGLITALSTETVSRISAVGSLIAALSSASVSFAAADGTFSGALSAEAVNRNGTIVSVSDAVASVTAALTATDATLSTALSTEVSARQSGVASIDNTASLSFALLNVSNTVISTAISAEISARTSTVASVSGAISTSLSALQSTDAALKHGVSSLSAALALKATTSFLDGKISMLLNGAPSQLNTLAEMAAALENNPNFASSITAALATKTNVSAVNSLSLEIATKGQTSQLNSLATVVSDKASAATLTTVNSSVIVLNTTMNALTSIIGTLRTSGGSVNANSIVVDGVDIPILATRIQELYYKLGSINPSWGAITQDGAINYKLNRLANPSLVNSTLGFEYDATGAVTKVNHRITVKFDKDQTSATVTGGVGNPTTTVNNMVLDASNNYVFAIAYAGDVGYYATNKTSASIVALETPYKTVPETAAVTVAAANEADASYKHAAPTVVTPYDAATWNFSTGIVTQKISVNSQIANAVLKFGLGGYSNTDITIEAVSGASAVAGQTNQFAVSGDHTAVVFNVKYLRSLVAATGSKSITVTVLGTSSKLPSNALTVANVINDISQFAAPTLAGSVSYSGTADSYTAIATYATDANVSHVKAMKSDGTTIIASQAVSSGSVTLTFSYATADITGSKTFYIVALGNNYGGDSAPTTSYGFLYPPPILSNFIVETKPRGNAFTLTQPTSTSTVTYTPQSYSKFVPTLSISSTFRFVVKPSADGNTIAVGGISGNTAGIVRVYSVSGGAWAQLGGDINGSVSGGYAGIWAHELSMSADGTRLITISNAAAINYESYVSNVILNIFKYDPLKSTPQTNAALPNFGPASWSRISSLTLTSRPSSAVISADGKSIVVSDITLRMYYTPDDGVTWIQRGTSIVDPTANNYYFGKNIAISANGLTVVASTIRYTVNAQALVYEWNGAAWKSSLLHDFNEGDGHCAISKDGTIAITFISLNSANSTTIRRYTKNVSGVWTIAWSSVVSFATHIDISANGDIILMSNYGNYKGDIMAYRWNGSSYVALINNGAITDRVGYTNPFNAMLSADGNRIVAGGNMVDVFDINVQNKFTYSSSNENVAKIYHNLVIMQSDGDSVITATQTTASGSATITSPLNVLPHFLEPVLSGSITFAGSAGSYTATATYTVAANVTHVKVMNTNGTIPIASQAVSSGSVTLSIPYVASDVHFVSFLVVAMANSFGGDSISTTLCEFLYPPPILSNFSVGAKFLRDSTLTLTQPTTTSTVTYIPQSYSKFVPTLSVTRLGVLSVVVKPSADGNTIAVGGISGNTAGIVRVYSVSGGAWAQLGGDINGSVSGGYAGIWAHELSMSADGTRLITISNAAAINYESYVSNVILNIFKYDPLKSTPQTNAALPNFGPALWSRISTLTLNSRPSSAVISADGKSIVVSDVTLRMYYTTDDGVTWTQRGTSIVDPTANNNRFAKEIAISANGLTVVATTVRNTVNAQALVYEWNGAAWQSSLLHDFGSGTTFCAISKDGTLAMTFYSEPNQNRTTVRRCTKNVSGVWTIESSQFLIRTIHDIDISANGDTLAVSLDVGYVGDIHIYRWNGSSYVAAINNRTIPDRVGYNYAFQSMLSADGNRIVAGGSTVDVFDINVKNKITYSSSNASAASTHSNLVIMKSAGNTTVTATQTTATGSATITSDLTILNTGVVSTGTLTLKSSFGSYGNNNTGFYLPSGVAIDVSGNMVIVDALNGRVKVHNMANNAFIMTFGSNGSGDGQFSVSGGHGPQGVATFMSGNIVVSDTRSNRMQVFNKTGTFILKFGSNGSGDGQFAGPRGVAIDHRNKNIIVADAGNNRIQVFSETGTFIRTFGSFGVGNGDLKLPTGVATDIGGNIYVADTGNNRIQVFSETGTFIRAFGSTGSGNGQLNSPTGIAMDATGKIIVIDYNNSRVQIFNNDGTHVTGLSGNGLNQPGYIAVNALGNIILTNSNSNSMFVIG